MTKGIRLRKHKGSYTVEAAVVVTLTFFVLAALIICSFYIHDRAVFQSAACEAAAAGSNFATAEERSAAASKVKEGLTSGRLLGSKSMNGSAAAGNKEASASWNAVYPVPGFAAKFLSANKLKINQSWKCTVHDPADTIRKIRGADALLTGGDN